MTQMLSVTTPRVASHAPVTLGTWEVEPRAQVSNKQGSQNRNTLQKQPGGVFTLQISMSVLRTVMAVSRCVRTQKGALSVAAPLDMNSMEMAGHAVVCYTIQS